MANRNEESGREESAYGRSGNPQQRQQSSAQNWRETQVHQQGDGQQQGRQGTQGGVQGRGQQGVGSGEFGERSPGWESERGSDLHGGQDVGLGSQVRSQRAEGYGQGGQDYGMGRQRSGQSGQGYGIGSQSTGHSGQGYDPGGERYGRGGQGYGQEGQQHDWQRATQIGWQGGERYGSQGYGMGQDSALAQGRHALGEGGISRGYSGMTGGYGEQPLGYGSSLGQRGFRGVGPKNYSRSDERIREDVCERLTQDDDLDASEIEIKTVQGVVTLEGTVEQRWMKHRAEDLAESCSGVREVDNRIRVQSGAGKERSGPDLLGKSGAQGDGRSQSGTRGSSGTSGFSGSTPH